MTNETIQTNAGNTTCHHGTSANNEYEKYFTAINPN